MPFRRNVPPKIPGARPIGKGLKSIDRRRLVWRMSGLKVPEERAKQRNWVHDEAVQKGIAQVLKGPGIADPQALAVDIAAQIRGGKAWQQIIEELKK